VVCMQGRFHPFEGYSLALCTLPIKLFKLLGCKMLILTNAAGILNRSYNVGDLMVIKDHISLPVLSLQHPLVGPNDERFGPRFPPINQIYGKKYRELFMECAKELSIDVREGVYSSIGGPSYETVSDSRFLIQIGADCVGMSTSHEAMVACYCGLKVLGFSILTDKVPLEFDSEDVSDHNEVIKIANRKAKEAEKLVARILEKLNENPSLIEN
jgi:purine-nucleoside phosphorylase